MTNIHPTAIVDPAADVAASAQIGPYCVIGPDVRIGEEVILQSHVVVAGRTRIGNGTEIFPFASIGHRPQDLKYRGEPSVLEIGENNTIREYVTLNPGTEGGGMLTRIGNNNLLMCSAHVGHDCVIGDHCILVNNATLGGHVTMQDFAIVGGNSAVHQFVRIGKHAMIGGMTGVEHDVIPYGSATGDRASLQGLNLVGLKRRGFSRDEIHAARAAYKMLFRSDAGKLNDRVEEVSKTYPDMTTVTEIVDFLQADSHRGITLYSGNDNG